MTQWAGLVSSCVTLPELSNTSALLHLAFVGLEGLLSSQVYPDGIEFEEAFGYDMLTAADFLTTVEMAERAGYALSQSYRSRVEAMYNYAINVLDQDGFDPRNGDTDIGQAGNLIGKPNGWSPEAQKLFNRPDWLYVHTNGRQGVKPPGPSPSIMFPWGGQAVLRGGFEKGDHWCWFQVGVHGAGGHGHRGRLAFNLRSHGSMLLVDSGRFQYAGTGLSNILHNEYASTTAAHNTLTIDGKNQKTVPSVATMPLSSSSWSFQSSVDFVRSAVSEWEGLDGSATHTRAILYVRGKYYIVVDCVDTDRPRRVQTTWHAHPNSTIALNVSAGDATVQGVETGTGRPTTAQLVVIPAVGEGAVGATTWENYTVVKGQNKSAENNWQGWYSETYNGKSPAPTLVYDTLARRARSLFGWLLVPTATRETPRSTLALLKCADDVVTVRVDSAGSAPQQFQLPLSGNDAESIDAGARTVV